MKNIITNKQNSGDKEHNNWIEILTKVFQTADLIKQHKKISELEDRSFDIIELKKMVQNKTKQ